MPAATLALSASTIVAIRCNVPELEEQGEDFLAGQLRNLNVNAVDPSAIDVTYHQRSRVVILDLIGAEFVDYASIAWVTRKYHARRLLVAEALLSSSSLPYGDFSVFNVRARCSYRAFDTLDKRIISGGSVLGTARGEDEHAAQEDALQAAFSDLAARAARQLV
jgi:hypothetical protein